MIFLVLLILISILIIMNLDCFTKRNKRLEKAIPSEKDLLYKEYLYRKIPNYLENDKTVHEPYSNPKNLFRIWTCDAHVCGGWNLNQFSDTLELTRKNLPGWKEIIVRDKNVDLFLQNEFGTDHPVTRAFYLLNYGVMQADFLRILYIYKYGGLYLDMKSYVDGPLPEIPPGKDLWVGTWSQHKNVVGGDGEFQNFFIYGRKGSPILKSVIEKIIHNIFSLYETSSISNFLYDMETEVKNKILILTGPIAYTVAIKNSQYFSSVHHDNTIHNVVHYRKNNSIKPRQVNKHYSLLNSPLLKKYYSIKIPKVVYLTYHDIEEIPKYVISNLEKYCKGFDIRIYDDVQCIGFLQKYFGDQAVSIFKNMKFPAHKADFWRYCILYLFGGYYFDIKTKFKLPISEIFDSTKEKTWYTVLSTNKGHIYNGIIASPPFNPTLYDCIKHVFQNSSSTDYNIYIRHLFKVIGKSLKVGTNKQQNEWNCILFQEKCIDCTKKKCSRKPDRYNYNCSIYNKNKELLFDTRYSTFPWDSNVTPKYENPYYKNQFIKWKDMNDPFLRQNFPYTFDFDFDIKKDIINYAKTLPLYSAIIDCGAHIGDGAIPIAQTLHLLGRDDITVYAIDPSLCKVNFMKEMKKKNNLNNLIILQYGLSNNNEIYTHKQNQKLVMENKETNTGGTNWTNTNSADASKNDERIEFISLDSLVNQQIINSPIRLIHLDVEGMEKFALLGAKNVLKINKPYLSIEEHDTKDYTIRNLLASHGYKFKKRILNNNIYEC